MYDWKQEDMMKMTNQPTLQYLRIETVPMIAKIKSYNI